MAVGRADGQPAGGALYLEEVHLWQHFEPIVRMSFPRWTAYLPTPTPTASPTLTVASPPISNQTPTPTKSPSPSPTPSPVPTTVPMPDVRIDCILFDGQVSSSEPDEYVQISNHGQVPQDLLEWVLQDATNEKQRFTFRSSYIIDPGETIRVHTNEMHREWGGFSFERGRAIWNNKLADTAALLDDKGRVVSERSYDVRSPPGCSD